MLRGQPSETRQSVILRDGDHWAEAAPLPGFSSEDIHDVLNDIEQGAAIRSRHASLQFAGDCLRATIWPAIDLPINALLDGATDKVLQQTEKLRDSNCQSVKMKVGRSTIAEDILRVSKVRSILRRDQKLRLDANRAWTWDAALQFAKAVVEMDIEYIEEPLRSPFHPALGLEAFAKATSCRYALDESLMDNIAIDDFPTAAALIIKPTLLGSIQRIEQLATHDKPLVFSGCFESGIGTAHIARLAQQFSAGIPTGLDTHSRIRHDVIHQSLIDSDWRLKLTAPPTIDLDSISRLKI